MPKVSNVSTATKAVPGTVVPLILRTQQRNMPGSQCGNFLLYSESASVASFVNEDYKKTVARLENDLHKDKGTFTRFFKIKSLVAMFGLGAHLKQRDPK